jgi:hypothetical protein
MKLLLVAFSFMSMSLVQPNVQSENTSELELICVDVVICLSNGSSLLIKPRTSFKAKGKRPRLTGRSVMAEKYKVVDGSVSLKLGDKTK